MFTLGFIWFMGYAPISNKPIYVYEFYVCVDLAGDLNSDIISAGDGWRREQQVRSSICQFLVKPGGSRALHESRIEHCEGISTYLYFMGTPSTNESNGRCSIAVLESRSWFWSWSQLGDGKHFFFLHWNDCSDWWPLYIYKHLHLLKLHHEFSTQTRWPESLQGETHRWPLRSAGAEAEAASKKALQAIEPHG